MAFSACCSLSVCRASAGAALGCARATGARAPRGGETGRARRQPLLALGSASHWTLGNNKVFFHPFYHGLGGSAVISKIPFVPFSP